MKFIKKFITFGGIPSLLLIFFVLYVQFSNDVSSGKICSDISGGSMEPTFHSGENFCADNLVVPKINDVIYLTCFSKCTNNNNYLESERGTQITLLKRITQIDGDKIWVEGDNKSKSVDSRAYGWLSPSDFKLLGVVVQ